VRAVYADGGNIVFMVVLATGTRALTLTLYCVFKKKRLFRTREDTRQGIIGGLFQAFSISAFSAALLFMSGPLVITVLFTHTLMLLFFLMWKGEIKFSVLTLATTASALGGLSLVLDVWHKQSNASLWGIGIALLAAVATVFRLYVYGRQTRERNPAVVGAENFLTAAGFTLLLFFFQAPHAPLSLQGWGWALSAAAAASLATFAMFYGISLIGSFQWSLFAKLEPLFTSLFSVWFIHEVLKPYQYAGIAIVVSSLVLYQVANRSRLTPPPEVEALSGGS
jgi:drug/metabolite transporter (DMT)-like permease